MYKIRDGWLVFDERFDEPLDTILLPSQVKIIDLLPPDTQKIEFRSIFDHPVDALSKLTKLTHLKLSYYFNQPIDNLLKHLPNLTFLHLYGLFKHKITYLPPKLTYLHLSQFINYPLPTLPTSLKFLRIGSDFANELETEHLVNLIHFIDFSKYNLYLRIYYILHTSIKKVHPQFKDVLNRQNVNRHNRNMRRSGLFDNLIE